MKAVLTYYSVFSFFKLDADENLLTSCYFCTEIALYIKFQPAIIFKSSGTQSPIFTSWIIIHDFHTKKKWEEEDLRSSPLNLTKTVAGAGLSLMSGQLTMVAIHLKDTNPRRTLRKNFKTIRTSAWSATHAKIPLISQTTHQHGLDTPRHDGNESAICCQLLFIDLL